jgi:hypothetical protein
MLLGGMIRIDLISCTPHPLTSSNNNNNNSTPGTHTSPAHIRLTPFTNLPPHLTSTLKATTILDLPPNHFIKSNSLIEVVTSQAVGPSLQTSLDLEIKSTGNSQRNTIEIVFAGLGFVALGGNFGSAVVRVMTPLGRGVAVRKPVVEKIMGGDSLEVVRRRRVGRVVGRRKDGEEVEGKEDEMVGDGMEGKVDGDGSKIEGREKSQVVQLGA